MPTRIAIELCHTEQDAKNARDYWLGLGYTQQTAKTAAYERNGAPPTKQLAPPLVALVFEK